MKGLKASQPCEKIPVGHSDASNPKTPANTGSNGTKDYSFLFKYSRWGGEGNAYNGNPNRKRNDDTRRPKRSANPGGSPGGNDPDDNTDGSEDDDTPSGNGHSVSGSSNMHHSLTDLRPRSKLLTLHHKSLEWDGVRAKHRVYIIRWYDYLIDFEDTSAIMFLSRCVTPEFKELVLSYHELEPCLQNLATYCANEEMYCKRKLEEMKAAKLSRSY